GRPAGQRRPTQSIAPRGSSPAARRRWRSRRWRWGCHRKAGLVTHHVVGHAAVARRRWRHGETDVVGHNGGERDGVSSAAAAAAAAAAGRGADRARLPELVGGCEKQRRRDARDAV
ncbi:unnamed protein product, partial [Ectocarpus fasciculatus]